MKKSLPPQNDKEQWLYDVVYKAWVAFCTPECRALKSWDDMIEYARANTVPPISLGTPGRDMFEQYIADITRKRYLEIGHQAIDDACNAGHHCC